MEVYGLKNCDTCRKVKKELTAAGVTYRFHDFRDETPSRRQITAWAKTVGIKKLLNKSSTTWRNLPDADKGKAESEQAAIALMAEHPTLIKRPIIENGPTQVFAGWTKDVQEAVLGCGE